MSAAFAMSVPGSRPLAGWWRDLAVHEPSRLWFAHLVLHRLEVLVECRLRQPPRRPRRRLARDTSEPCRSPPTCGPLPADLHLDPALFRRIVDHLLGLGLLALDAEGRVSHVRTGSVAAPRLRQRRVLYFTDGTPAYFLPLDGSACTAMMPPAGWAFEVGRLDDFATRPPAWRRDNLFPADIRRFLHPADLPEPAQAEAVIVDRAEQSLLALVQTGDGILGFPVDAENWELQRTPALDAAAGLRLRAVPPRASAGRGVAASLARLVPATQPAGQRGGCLQAGTDRPPPRRPRPGPAPGQAPPGPERGAARRGVVAGRGRPRPPRGDDRVGVKASLCGGWGTRGDRSRSNRPHLALTCSAPLFSL